MLLSSSNREEMSYWQQPQQPIQFVSHDVNETCCNFTIIMNTDVLETKSKSFTKSRLFKLFGLMVYDTTNSHICLLAET